MRYDNPSADLGSTHGSGCVPDLESQPPMGLWPERRSRFSLDRVGYSCAFRAALVKALFWIGLTVMILGMLLLVVPVPRSQRDGFTVGGVSVGVETRHQEKVSPALSALMILGGLGTMVASRRTAL